MNKYIGKFCEVFLVCLIILVICSTVSVFSSDKPKVEEQVIEEVNEDEDILHGDFELMVNMCFSFIGNMQTGSMEKKLDYADGGVLELDSVVYMSNRVYFDNKLLVNFVSSSGDLYSLMTDGVVVRELKDLCDFDSLCDVSEFQIDENVLYSDFGKSSLDIDYFDRCLVQVSVDDKLITYLLHINKDSYILNTDVLDVYKVG